MAQQRPKHSTEPVRLLTASPSSHRSGAGCLVTELTQAALKIEARNRFLASRQYSRSPPPRSCISLTRRPAYGPTKSQHRRLLLLFAQTASRALVLTVVDRGVLCLCRPDDEPGAQCS